MEEDIIQQAIAAGGTLTFFYILFVLIPAILGIILFIKVWIMTNDVSKIKDMLREQLDLEHPYVEVPLDEHEESVNPSKKS